MYEQRFFNNRLTSKSYLHLNTSFSNHLGILDGKSAAVLYFASLDNLYYRSDISFSFLEEILNQIHPGTSLTFGTGIAGIGALLSYLNQKGILEEDPGELLAGVEPLLVEQCINNRLEEINLSSGICGSGLYFLSRIRNYDPADYNSPPQLYKDCVVRTVNQIEDRLSAYDNLKPSPHLFTIWHGLPGIYLYLQLVSRTNLVDRSIMELIRRVGNILSQWLDQTPPCWEMVGIHFALSKNHSSDRIWLSSFKQFLNKMSKAPVDFYPAAFHALLLKIIAGQHQIKEAAELSGSLKRFVIQTLSDQGLKKMFPFRIQEGSVPMGLDKGVCGTALPLLSLESGDYGWLFLLGMELEGDLIKT